VILDLMQGETDLSKVRQIENLVSEQYLASLLQENFKSTQNNSVSNVLALSAFFALKAKKLNEPGSVSALVSNEAVANYFMNNSIYTCSFINTQGYVEQKGKSLYQAQNQLHVIESLLRYHFTVSELKPPQLNCLLDTLCEILLNVNCTFRESAVLGCFDSLRSLGSKFKVPLFTTMFEKLTQVSLRPSPKLAENEFQVKQSLMIGKKIQFVVKMLYNVPESEAHQFNAQLLEKQEFFLLLRMICHPFVSEKTKDLMHILRSLTDILDRQAELNGDNREFALPSYFRKYFDDIVQYALVQRSGILSPNETLRQIAKNMLICLGWQGYLRNYIEKLVTILNYKGVEHAIKLRALIKKAASGIGPYEMMFFSEVSKDLLKLMEPKDTQIQQQELQTAQKAESEDPETFEEEEKK
jgi:hypothetical protein